MAELVQINQREEFEFLCRVEDLIQGQPVFSLEKPLRSRINGLYKRDGVRPLRLVLEEKISKACFHWIAHQGGAKERKFVVDDRIRTGSLVSPRIFSSWGPLEFSLGCFDLIEQLVDQGGKGIDRSIGSLRTLGDQVLLLRLSKELFSNSPDCDPDLLRKELPKKRIVGLWLGDFKDSDEYETSDFSVKEQIILTGLESGLVRSWIQISKRFYGAFEVAELGPFLDLGRSLKEYLKVLLRDEVQNLAISLLHFFNLLFLETGSPEAWISKAAKRVSRLNKVSEKEAVLFQLGSFFRIATDLKAELEKIRTTPRIDREEHSLLFFEASTRIDSQLLEKVEALSNSLQGKVE